METITLTYDNHAAALASRERFWLALHIAALPDGDPTKRLVTFMALYARDVLTGELPGPYSDERARSFARLALVEPSAYRAHRRRGDSELAGVLGLPVAEIPHVRREQHALAQPRPGPRRTRSRPDHDPRRGAQPAVDGAAGRAAFASAADTGGRGPRRCTVGNPREILI